MSNVLVNDRERQGTRATMDIHMIATALAKLTEFNDEKLKLMGETGENVVKLKEELERIQRTIKLWEEKQVFTKSEEEQKKTANELAEKTVSLLEEYNNHRGAGSGTEFLNKLWEFVLPSTGRHMYDEIREILEKTKEVKVSGHDAVLERAVLHLRSDKYYYGTTPTIDYSRDEQKRVINLGAKQLTIAWGESPQYWAFSTCVPASKKFPEVAKLKAVCWLDIRCSVETKILLKETTYGAYLVFKLADRSYGLQSVVGYVRTVNHETEAEAVKTARLLHLQSPPTKRTDGWMEVKLGDIHNVDDDGPVEARVFELSDNWKAGLTVAGIVFRQDMTRG